MRKVNSPRFDISGNSFFRVLRFNLVNTLIPTGNYRMGTGLRPGLTLLILHWFGRPMFRFLIHYEPHLHRIYQLIRKKQR